MTDTQTPTVRILCLEDDAYAIAIAEAKAQERERLRAEWEALAIRLEATGITGSAAAVGLMLGGSQIFADPEDTDD